MPNKSVPDIQEPTSNMASFLDIFDLPQQPQHPTDFYQRITVHTVNEFRPRIFISLEVTYGPSPYTEHWIKIQSTSFYPRDRPAEINTAPSTSI